MGGGSVSLIGGTGSNPLSVVFQLFKGPAGQQIGVGFQDAGVRKPELAEDAANRSFQAALEQAVARGVETSVRPTPDLAQIGDDQKKRRVPYSGRRRRGQHLEPPPEAKTETGEGLILDVRV